MKKLHVTKDMANKTLILERTFHDSLSGIWQAFYDRVQFERWWGPEGWQTTTKEFDFRVGGRIHYEMKCIDPEQVDWYGMSSWGCMDIESIDELQGFSYSDYFSDEAGEIDDKMPALHIEVSFYEEDDRTVVMTITSTARSEDQLKKILDMGVVEGFASQLNRLDGLLAEA